jgi:aminopeptidase N
MRTSCFLFLPLFFLIISCSVVKKETIQVVELSEPIIVRPPAEYRESPPILHQLIHTRLEVTPVWEKQQLNGIAYLTLNPYFFPQDSLFLDAKGFELTEVSLENPAKTPLKYNYDGFSIGIKLDKQYKRADTFTVKIIYIAKPEEALTSYHSAINEDKGLYFINPLGEDKEKPRQLWTQGQPESSSRWFPTIDHPNQRTTQEILITIDTSFITISNGRLVFSSFNGDGTRTDYWKQELNHPPYLAAMIIGEFAEIKDSWRDSIEVNYYVEKDFEPYARMVFGKTPEMMEFFSGLLKYDFPWEKYSQVVVRDYVSGAMENTGAVVYYDALQHDAREHLDNTYEDIIAHELFHHWFGNIVTNESWSNLALNEAFATYGEYLWNEYKHGREEADWGLQNDFNAYMQEAQYKKEALIRFNYHDPEELFDRHSYQKGGLILHMLRKHIGDDAFFTSLNRYLVQNEFKPVEFHHFRLAVEEVTGKDMNWFFNQWFLKPGHPVLEINHGYDPVQKEVVLVINQRQDVSQYPVYNIPVIVEVHSKEGKKKIPVTINREVEIISIPLESEPLLVNFDTEKMVLAEKIELKPLAQWIYQYRNTELYLDRYEAIASVFSRISEVDKVTLEDLISSALNDKFWNIRKFLIYQLREKKIPVSPVINAKIVEIAKSDPKSAVRAEALLYLSSTGYNDKSLYLEKVNDSSYTVVSEALGALNKLSSKDALEVAKSLENERNSRIKISVGNIYAENPSSENHLFFKNALRELNQYQRYSFLPVYARYLERADPEIKTEGIAIISQYAETTSVNWQKVMIQTILARLKAK